MVPVLRFQHFRHLLQDPNLKLMASFPNNHYWAYTFLNSWALPLVCAVVYMFLAARSRGEQCWQGGDGGEDTTQGGDQTIWVWWKIPFSVSDIYYSDTTAMNPQFHIQIPRSGAAKCHVVVSLTLTILIKSFSFVLWNKIHLCQIISRKSHYLVQVSVTQQYETNVSNNKKKRTLHHIGFAVYEVPPNMTRLSPQYVLEHVSLALCIFFYRFYPLS